MKTKIFVITHKKFKMNNIKDYVPLQVGAVINTNLKTNYLKDNVGDNISSRNRNYCELTGVYWLWKNYNDIDNIGICHYRRFFSKKMVSTNEKYFLRSTEIEEIIKQYDIILPKKLRTKGTTVYRNFIANSVKEKDIENTKKVLKKLFPDYLEEFNKILESSHLSFANMMITRKKIYDQYCEWLFKILFEVEKITDFSKRTNQQLRVFGYLSEILLNVWVNTNKLKIKYFPVVQTEIKHNIIYYLKLILEKLNLYNLIYDKLKNNKH